MLTCPLPLHFQVGVSLELLRSGPFAWHLATDVTHPNDNRERINVGSELALYNQVFVRGGYRYHYDDEDLTFGFGFAFPVEGSDFTFDYAYSRYDLLPDVHRFSLGFQF